MKRFILSFVSLLCVACSSPVEQSHSADTQQPHITTRTLVTSDRVQLPLSRWSPAESPKAVIVALHGFNDYSHAFVTPGAYMRQHDIALYAYDQRGFGHAIASGIWPGERNLVSDAADMVRAARKRYPNTPVYLLGESMGGAAGIVAVTSPGFPRVDGLILVAPALWGGDTMNPVFRGSLWLLAHTWPSKKLTGEDLHILASDNIDMLRALGGDPYFIKATRADAIYGLVQLMDDGYSRIEQVKVPMLILYGAHDQVIPPYAIVKAIRKVHGKARVAYYPLGYHMLLRDLHGDVPVRDIVSWIGDKNKPLPSGYDSDAEKKLNKFMPRTSRSRAFRAGSLSSDGNKSAGHS